MDSRTAAATLTASASTPAPRRARAVHRDVKPDNLAAGLRAHEERLAEVRRRALAFLAAGAPRGYTADDVAAAIAQPEALVDEELLRLTEAGTIDARIAAGCWRYCAPDPRPAPLPAARVRRLWAARRAMKRKVAALLGARRAFLTAAEIAAAAGIERETTAAELCEELCEEGRADLHVAGGTWRYAAAGVPVPGPGGLTWASVLHATLRAVRGRDLEPGDDPIALWAAWSKRAERTPKRRREVRHEA